jgi:hypothetical protein
METYRRTRGRAPARHARCDQRVPRGCRRVRYTTCGCSRSRPRPRLRRSARPRSSSSPRPSTTSGHARAARSRPPADYNGSRRAGVSVLGGSSYTCWTDRSTEEGFAALAGARVSSVSHVPRSALSRFSTGSCGARAAQARAWRRTRCARVLSVLCYLYGTITLVSSSD